MAWYVRRNGELVGPVSEEVVIGWVQQGMTDGSVRRDGDVWRPIVETHFVQYFPVIAPGPPNRPAPPPGAQRSRGLGCGWWLAILAVGGCTIGACVAVPHIGWTGLLLMFGLWSIARHLERQNELLEALRDQRDPWD